MRLGIFGAPLMWRRHVKAQERIARALEDLLAIQMKVHGFGGRPSDPDETYADDAALSYASDHATFEAEAREKKFPESTR